MTTINLKDFYPWYTHDEYIEVSEEVADELRASRLYEAAYQRRIVRNKAQYSLCLLYTSTTAAMNLPGSFTPTPTKPPWRSWAGSSISSPP